jgi:hypothetical protein
MGCFNVIARNHPANYNPATCQYMAYLLCCPGNGALNSDVVLATFDPAACTFSAAVGIADVSLGRTVEALNACAFTMIQSCSNFSIAFVRSFGRTKSL